jgi:hypothetical protein
MLAYAVRAAPPRTARTARSDIVSRADIPAGSRQRTFTPASTMFAMAQGTLLDKKVINP